MKVLIGIPTGHVARQAIFYDYYHQLEKPEGSGMIAVHGQSPARARNIIIDHAIQHDFTHILFLDDDLAFKPDLLNRLLSHDKDIVTGLYLMRNYPHQPIIFDESYADGRCTYHFPTDEESGLIEVVNCGFGCVLIKTEIFKNLEKPYVRLGELEKDHWCDDIGFFLRVREAGFKIHCDLDVMVGHMHFMTIWPNKIDGKWLVSYDTYGPEQVSFKLWRPEPGLKEKELELAGVS